MKLKWKLAGLCAAVMAVLSLGLAENMYAQVLRQTWNVHESALEQQSKQIRTSFEEQGAKICAQLPDSPGREILLRDLFQSLVTGPAVLRLDGKTVYDSTNQIFPESDTRQGSWGSLESTHDYIRAGFGSSLLSGPKYELYLLENFRGTYSRMEALYRGFLKSAAMTLVAGVAVLVLILWRSLRPLGQLQQAAARIADGAYDQRATVKRKDEVGLLAGDFNRMAQAVQTHIEELTEQNRRQQQFLRAVTHEFKTPMTSLLLNVETLETMALPEPERQDILSDMDRQLTYLEALVQKLLKLLTLGQAPNREAVEKAWLGEQIQALCGATAQQRGVSLKLERDEEPLLGDGELLCAALRNLTENAILASPPGAAVTLRLLGKTLEVEDRGCGIPKEQIPRLTEPFYTVDPSRSKGQGGVGLGLSLVKAMMDAQGGALQIESTPGQGTVARLLLPKEE